MFAKLFQGGALPKHGAHFATLEIPLGLGLRKRTTGGDFTPYTLPFAQEVSIQYVLISGEALAREVRSPTRKWKHHLGKDEWKAWAVGFQTLAAESEGDMKEKGEKAFAKMVALLPELFVDEDMVEE
jgi:hypothetical protein